MRSRFEINLNTLETYGSSRLRGRKLAGDDRGGSVTVQVAAVHTHQCRYWRWGKRHAPCSCGANEAWDAFFARAPRAQKRSV